jgi:serine phosphatase RsbU (regulator of sigma subunit)
MGVTTIFQRIFQGLDQEALDILRSVAQVRAYPPQTVLCHQGASEHTFYVITEGRVAIVQRLDDGQERPLAIRGPGEYFGELGLLDNTPRMADCTTLTPVTVLEITEEIFDELVERSPAVAYAIMRRTLHILRDTDRAAIEDLTAKNAKLQQAYRDLEAAQERLVEKERLVRELEIAAEVQRTLLPEYLPEYTDYRFAAYLQPARLVGGDFYDVIHLDDEHVGLLIADVADKSVQAALFMAVTRTLFAEAAKHSLSPAAVALSVHRSMFDVAPASEMFVTAFYGVLHRPTGCLTYVLAGHERPYLLQPGRLPVVLKGRGRFLGMVEALELEEFVLPLVPGDRLLLFSDGVPDAAVGNGEQYGYDRLVQLLKRSRVASVEQLVDEIATDVVRYCQGTILFDDLTLLAVEAL